LNQTYKFWECIIVDDYSTDNTKNTVFEFLKKDDRFRYILNERTKGAQGARNTGVLHAKGEWVAFNDSDDEWVPEKLEMQMKVVNEFTSNQFLVIHGDCIVNNHSKSEEYIWHLPYVNGNRPYEVLLKNPSPMFQAMLTSKVALESVGYLDEDVLSYQEWSTSLKLAKYCHFIHIQEPLFIYYKHQSETMSKDIRKDIEGKNYIRVKYMDDFIKYYGEKEFGNTLVDDLLVALDYKYIQYGKKLMSKAKPFVSRGKYFILRICFMINLNVFRQWSRLSNFKLNIIKSNGRRN
jgi:glycosyltransferase involved in cell wall biosynthesis